MKVIVIGGGAAGMMFSTQYKKSNPNDDVTVFEKTEFVAWAGCPTPYYISNELSFSHVVLGTPEDFIKRGVDVKTKHEVINVDFKNKNITVNDIELNTTNIVKYDKLIIAVGGKSFIPNIKGYDPNLSNIFTLSHAVNAVSIKKFVDENENKIKKAVVVGAGFIGLEMAETFKKRGLDVTIIEKSNTIFPTLSEDIKSGLFKEIEKQNVDLLLNTEVVEIKNDNGSYSLILKHDGETSTFDFDIALFSIGITPNISHFSGDLNVSEGKIVVNKQFETNIPDVYAIGDAIYNKFYKTDNNVYTPFGDIANKHGMLLAKYLSGNEAIEWNGVLRSFATSFYDLKIAQTGYTLEEALKLGYNADVVSMRAMYKNSGFEDSIPNKVEIVYDKDKKILLGGSIIGVEAVAQFLDQIAIVTTLKTPIEKFIEIDFAYSPTNASVWNPLLVMYRKVIK